MNLNTSLMLIGQRFGFDAEDLMRYAAEDTAVGGYHSNEALAKWMIGSLWEVEGQTLYALVRAVRPLRVVEVGTHRGASATHIAQALAANDGGQIKVSHSLLTGCDLGNYGGDLIPPELREWVQIKHVNGIDYLADEADGAIGLIFEDSSHDAATTEAIAVLAQTKLAPGGVLVIHDAAHWVVGGDVRSGLDAANLPGGYGVYLCEPSDCGLAIWRQPVEFVPPGRPEAPKEDAAESPTPDKSKSSRRKKTE